jgi:hypothetical protein
MKKTFTLLVLLVFMACTSENQPADQTQEKQPAEKVQKLIIDEDEVTDEPFGIEFQIKPIRDNEFELAVSIILDSGSYVVSSSSEDNFYGHFEISINPSDHLILDHTVSESPNSIEEFDPILKRNVKFVRVNTTFKQQLMVTSQNDFEDSGSVWFMLEPICIPYNVGFSISSDQGELKVAKTKTTISSNQIL